MDRPWVSAGMRVAEIALGDLPCLLLQRTARIRGRKRLTTPFVKILLSTQGFVDYFEPILSGVSVPHISPDQVGNFLCTVPPISEQKEICNFIGKMHQAIDKAQSKEFESIQKLQELKSTLINSAVTGKIRV